MMTQEQAIAILIQVAHLAQKAGILTLQDAPTVATAVQVLTPKPVENPKVEKKEDTKPKK